MTHQINLMEVYLIEILRANGISNQEIIRQVKARDLDGFQAFHEEFDFSHLIPLDEAGILEAVLEYGYEVKFLTFNGLVNLLQLKFHKEEGKHYQLDGFTIKQLQVSEEEKEQLAQLLSSNWNLLETVDGLEIHPIAS